MMPTKPKAVLIYLSSMIIGKHGHIAAEIINEQNIIKKYTK